MFMDLMGACSIPIFPGHTNHASVPPPTTYHRHISHLLLQALPDVSLARHELCVHVSQQLTSDQL